MYRFIFSAIAVVAAASAAHSQTGQPAPSVQPDATRMSGDAAERFLDSQTMYNKMHEDVSASDRSLRPVPAKPRDILQGLEVHDSKGLVIGSVASLGSGFAIVAGPVGRVEVDFASFAKNKNGLLINLPKAKIDAMMAGIPKP
jgi:opacity protein-like surface antigen